jgi:tetratricopeptide (TPR) repeat protein
MPPRVSAGLAQAREPMVSGLQLEAVQRVIFAIDRGDTLHGLIALECSPELRSVPAAESYLGYCMARERGQIREAVRMCQAALNAEPNNPAHYLNLGRVFLLAQDKAKAIAAFWKGISKAPGVEQGVLVERAQRGHSREHGLILDELRRLGIRKKAPFASLHRAHPLNRVAGRLLATLGLR